MNAETEPVVDDDSEETGAFYCPDCGGTCWNEAKALDCCADDPEGGDEPTDSHDSPDIAKETREEPGSGDANPGSEAEESASSDPPDPERVENAVADLLRHYHQQLDRKIADHTEAGEHPDRPTTAREYFQDVRGWSDATLDEALLGYAPADDDEVADALVWDAGYTREELLATGLFYDDLTPKWRGRYVLPYRDEDGRPVYGISRCTGEDGGGAAGYDGHPADSGYKYDKHMKSPEYARPPDEPIFGLGSVEDGEPLLVAGGIADAITLHQAGYPCISPVTTVRFKGDHEERVVELVEEYDIPTVYVVNDAERPTVEEKEIDVDAGSIGDALTIEQYGEGLRGAFGDADFLLDAGIDTRLVELPRAGRSLRKVDPDDYVHDEWGDLGTVLAAAKPAEQHPGYDREERAMQTAAGGIERERERSTVSADSDLPSGDHSALFDLDVRDVTGRSWGSRDVNPLGHHGNSENYYVLVEQHGVGYDHKYKKAYNALTHLLVEAGERRAENPNGRFDDAEILAVWLHAKGEGLIPDDDPIPHRALRHVALSRGFCEGDDIEDGWKLPVEAYNDALDAVREEFDLDPGRRPLNGEGGGEPVEPVPSIPFAMLSRPHDEVVRYARKRGLEWPSTDAARDRLGEALREGFRDEGYTILDAPTGLGKTHEASATFWRQVDEAVTGGRPVVLFASTTDARDEARRMAREAGLDVKALLGYKEACEVAGGAFDPENVDEDDDREPRYIEGVPAGQWFEERVENRGIAVSSAHSKAERLAERGYVATTKEKSANGRGDAVLPCCPEDLKCRTETQWPSDGWTDEERVRCGVTDHTVDECDDCYTDRQRCDDAGTEGHAVAECGDCHDERVRCERHVASERHTVDECDDCYTDRDPRYDLVIATDPFAYVPGLRADTNVIHDEQPDYTVEFGDSDEAHQQRIQRAVTAFLKAADAPREADTFAGLIQTAEHGFSRNDLGKPRDQRRKELDDALHTDLPRDWFFECGDAHTLAPALARSIYYAAMNDPDENGRRSATVPHEPPRLDAGASDDNAWNRTWVTVVLDDEDGVATVRDVPDFSTARSVVGLDAWPNSYLWQRNVHPAMTRERVLDTEERSLWRRLEQGKLVVGVGNATRPAGGDGEYFTESHADAIVSQLREEFGEDFQAAGCASAVEGRVRELLDDHGVDLPDDPDRDFTDEAREADLDGGTMHYGEENSRNDLAEYAVGLVYGCIDPGDDYVLDLAAECDLDVRPAEHEHPTCEGEGCGAGDPDCHDGMVRTHGREFVGEDSDDGAALLSSVRENHVAQMTGRFGRAESVEQSVVFVATDATPPGLVDVTVPGVLWLARPNQKQRELVEHLRANPSSTAREASDTVDCSKEHARQVFTALVEQGKATVTDGDGDHGADVYRWLSGASASATPFASVDLAPDDLDADTANTRVCSSYTWQLVVSPDTPTSTTLDPPSSIEQPSPGGSQTSLGGFDGVDRPPDTPD